MNFVTVAVQLLDQKYWRTLFLRKLLQDFNIYYIL